MTKHRVVVTGLGAITPLGNTVSEFWDGVKKGASGVAPLTLFDSSDHSTKFGAEVKNFDPAVMIDRKESRRMDRFTQFAVVAADEAARDAGLEINEENRDR